MSLVSYASIWTNENDTNESKKRIPSMRRTQKKPQFQPNTSLGEAEEYNGNEMSATPTNSKLKDDIEEQESRQNRVSQLVNKLTNTNDGNALADFNPIANPVLNKKTDDLVVASREADVPLSYQSNPMQISPVEIRRESDSNYSPNLPNLGNIYGTSYQRVYDQPKIPPLSSYYGGASQKPGALDDRFMEKINYMIHLLEQQHDEKTSNITEEFVLYTFLGVFIIFIVDSFARAGKYTR
jgi:hypothetical protein